MRYWLFFHNKYDQGSKVALDYIMSLIDEDSYLHVIDVFEEGTTGIDVPYVPYLVNKHFKLKAIHQICAGTNTFEFFCINSDGKKMSRSGIPVNIIINEAVYQVKTICGEIVFDVNMPLSASINIKLQSEEFFPLILENDIMQSR